MSADGGRVVLLEASRALDKTSTGFVNAANPFLDKMFIFDSSRKIPQDVVGCDLNGCRLSKQ